MSAELKGLQVRKTNLESEIKTLEAERDRYARESAAKKIELNSVIQKINNSTKKEPIVSEHALLRYIERVLGVDVDAVRAAILTEGNRKVIEFSGSCKIKSGGVELVVKDRCVVSVVA